MSTVIEAVGLVKRYRRGRPALAGLDLRVEQGEVFGFLGPNGAGKTTTMRLLLDLVRPSGGSLRVLGQEPRMGGPALRRRMGYLPGDVRVAGRQSGRALLLHLAQLRGGVRPGRIEELAGRLSLDLDAQVRQLSKGNRQKLGIVQAFMHRPELLLLDEPTSGLDPLYQQLFLDLVREAVADGATVVMSSHVLAEVAQVAGRVGILREGRLIAAEDLAALRQRAAQAVTIRFEAPVPLADFQALAGLEGARMDGLTLHARLSGPVDALLKAAARHPVSHMTLAEPDLEALFFHHYRQEDRDAA